MSDSLMQFAEPLLDEVGYDVASWRDVIGLAAIVWNAVVCGQDRDATVEEVEERVGDRARSEAIVDVLIDRKQGLFPADNRLVMAAEVYRRGQFIHVTAASMR